MVSVNKWWLQIAIAVDQLVNAVLRGWADEALSARAWRNRHKPLGKWSVRIINGLFFWQRDHCHSAWESEVERRQLPKAYREVSA
jgi:hypothetical protein